MTHITAEQVRSVRRAITAAQAALPSTGTDLWSIYYLALRKAEAAFGLPVLSVAEYRVRTDDENEAYMRLEEVIAMAAIERNIIARQEPEYDIHAERLRQQRVIEPETDERADEGKSS